MNAYDTRFAASSARHILPLAAFLGLVGVVVPVMTYLVVSEPEARSTDTPVFLVGIAALAVGFTVVLLLFLWIAEWLTEESEAGEA